MSCEIIFPFIIHTDDYHEFEYVKRLLIALDVNCEYQELDKYDPVYSAVFYVGGVFPINLKDENDNDVRVINI